MSEHLQQIRKKLSQAGLKATQQRMVVYQALLRNMHLHPTAESVYETVRPDNPSISLGTVYKILDVLVSTGLASKVATDQGFMRYDANMEQHNHIYCTNTREIIDYHDKELDHLIEEYFRNKKINNLKISRIQVQISGNKEVSSQSVEIDNQ
ncbi:MAG: Fur family transcriptional regulator [Cyclobacteriaceae bacterium]